METGSDKFLLRHYEESDYELFSSWWCDPPPKSSLPKIGLVCGDMKAVGFLARTDCDFTIITWWHANPLNNGKESYMALKILVKGLCDASTLVNKSKIFCYTTKRGMVKMLESLKFINHNGHLIMEKPL